MPVCYKCGRKENAMKCACEDCINKPIEEIDKLIRQLDSEKQCVEEDNGSAEIDELDPQDLMMEKLLKARKK